MNISLEQAEAAIKAAKEKSKQLDVLENIAIVDAGVNLVAFERMDGAWIGSIDLALRKAKTARYFDMETGQLGAWSQPGGPAWQIEHSNGGLVTFPGGIPLKNSKGEIIGAIGASGSTVENDYAVARAGAEAVKNLFTFLVFVLLFSLAPKAGFSQASGLDPKKFDHVLNEDIVFQNFPAFPHGAQMATVVGTPASPGPFVVRVKLAAGTKFMPHVHAEDRIYTVLSGIFYIGYGSVFDPSKLKAYGPGSVIVLPANTPHFHWAMSGQYITQVYAYGPLKLSYVNPADDPRNKK